MWQSTAPALRLSVVDKLEPLITLLFHTHIIQPVHYRIVTENDTAIEEGSPPSYGAQHNTYAKIIYQKYINK